ncbi:hypothetical protein J3F84DRAFT_358564 [Trichoderma pleuroticola]
MLFKRYCREQAQWSNERWKELHVVAPTMDYSIQEECEITDHRICKDAIAGSATWIHAWFLKVLFGNFVCERQPWMEGLKEELPVIHEKWPPRREYSVFVRQRVIHHRRQQEAKVHSQKIEHRTRKIIEAVKNHDDEKIRKLLEKKPHMETDLATAIQNVLSSHYPVVTISD